MFFVEVEDRERGQSWGYRGETYNWVEYRRFIEHAIPLVDYFILHDEKGVETLVDWPRKETRLEKWARDYFGTDASPEPPVPPEPPTPGAKLFVTAPDKNGVRSIRVEFPGLWPRVVPGIKSEDRVTEIHDVDLPEAFTFYAAGSFIGLDRGDIGEYAVVIAARGGPEIYSRSLHKETIAAFDSEDWKHVAFVTTDKLRIWLVAGTGGANDILRAGQPWSSRPHFGVRLWTYTGHHTQ